MWVTGAASSMCPIRSRRTLARVTSTPQRSQMMPLKRTRLYYFSFLLDRANRAYLAMCSAEGGMEIEQLAVEKPDALARVPVDPVAGVDAAKAREIAEKGNLPEAIRDQAVDVIVKLWDVFTGEE